MFMSDLSLVNSISSPVAWTLLCQTSKRSFLLYYTLIFTREHYPEAFLLCQLCNNSPQCWRALVPSRLACLLRQASHVQSNSGTRVVNLLRWKFQGMLDNVFVNGESYFNPTEGCFFRQYGVHSVVNTWYFDSSISSFLCLEPVIFHSQAARHLIYRLLLDDIPPSRVSCW